MIETPHNPCPVCVHEQNQSTFTVLRVLTSCEFINFVIIMVDGVKYM